MGTMPCRILSVVIGLVMLWSSFGSAEAPLAMGGGQPALAFVPGGPADRRDGSVVDHHLDDQSAHAGPTGGAGTGDPVSIDATGLPSASALSGTTDPVPLRPSLRTAFSDGPDLETPRRPPRAPRA